MVSLVEEHDRLNYLNPHHQTLVTLWYLANTGGFRLLGQQFGIGTSTAHDIVQHVLRILNKNADLFITFPKSEQEMIQIAQLFFDRTSFPNTLGAIDGTLVEFMPPKIHQMDYIDRKSKFSMNLTVICDSDMRFLAATCGYSGKCHDSRIYSETLKPIVDNIPPVYHIVGDAAYGQAMRMMTPYCRIGADETQELYNKVQSSTRIVVERAFAQLKECWRKMTNIESDMNKVCQTVLACLILHNIKLGPRQKARRGHMPLFLPTDCGEHKKEEVKHFVTIYNS